MVKATQFRKLMGRKSWYPSSPRKRDNYSSEELDLSRKGRRELHQEKHHLKDDEIGTILSVTYSLVSFPYVRLVYFDLVKAKYKICDWIAMLLDGRGNGNEELTRIMTSNYLKSDDLGKFIKNLQNRKNY